MRGLRSILLVALVLLPAGCGDGDDSPDAAEPVTVVASFAPLAEAARVVGGERVEVRNLVEGNEPARGYEPTEAEIDAIQSANLLVHLRGSYQPAVDELADEVSGQAVDVLDQLAVPGDDPHVWLDPVLMADIVEAVEQALVRIDADGAEQYEANAAAFQDRLGRLHAEFDAALATCERNVVVVSRASFRYLTARYRLEQEAVADPGPEPDPSRLDDLVELVTAGGVTTVFLHPGIADPAAEDLARQTGVQTAVLDPVERPGKDGYVTRMRANLAALRAGLDCA